MSFERVTTAERGGLQGGEGEERAEAWRTERRPTQGPEKSIAGAAAVLMATLIALRQFIPTTTKEPNGYIYYEVVPKSKTARYIHQRGSEMNEDEATWMHSDRAILVNRSVKPHQLRLKLC